MEPIHEAKQPVNALAGPYGHPLHPALVPVPLGAWIASFVFDVASHFASEPRVFSEGARWLIGLGVLGALAAAALGFLDLLAIRGGTGAFRTAIIHMSLNLAVTAAYGASFALRPSTGAAPVGWPYLVVSGVCLALLGASGYLGGKLVYRYGVRVATEDIQSEGFHVTAHHRRALK